MNNSKKPSDPFYVSNLQLYFAIVLSLYIIYIGQVIVLPLVFSILVAILLNPLVDFLIRKKINRVIAIILVLIVSIVFLAGIIFFITYEMNLLADSLPQIKVKFNSLVKDLFDWIGSTFNLSPIKVKSWVDKITKQGLDGGAIIGQVTSVIRASVNILLVPVYLFLILLYKPLLLTFINRIFSDHNPTVIDVENESKSLIQQYLVGLIIEAGIFATLNSIGLAIIGVEYAIMFGVISALLNLIPYLGGVIAMMFVVSYTLVTKSPSSAFFVFLSFTIVQTIDNNFIVPKIVGSQVKINPLVSIVAVLTGGELFGVTGMFLSIPVTAIMKVVFDRVERMKPFGLLLGDDQPPLGKGLFKARKHKK